MFSKVIENKVHIVAGQPKILTYCHKRESCASVVLRFTVIQFQKLIQNIFEAPCFGGCFLSIKDLKAMFRLAISFYFVILPQCSMQSCQKGEKR